MTGRSDTRAAILAVVGAAMLFGTTGTAQSLGPDNSSPWGVGTLRIVVGSLALWLLARSRPRRADLIGRNGRTLLLGGIGVAIYQPAFFLGTGRLGVTLGTMITLSAGPVIAGMLDRAISGVRPSRTWMLGTFGMIVGAVLLVIGTPTGADLQLDVIGVAGSIAAGTGYALYAVMARRAVTDGMHSTRALAWEHTIGSLILAPGLAVVPLGWVASMSGTLMLIHLGLFTVGVAYVLYGLGLRVLDSSTAVSITLVEPLTATVLAVSVLDERRGVAGWFGAAIVILGLAIIGRGSHAATPGATH